MTTQTNMHPITVEQYEHSFPGIEGFRDELIHGRIVMTPKPKPLHQQVRQNVTRILGAACEGTGYIANGGSNIELSPIDMPSPDTFVVSWPAWRRAIREDKYINVKPMLAVEVLSPGEDVSAKMAIYLAARIDAIWVVDPDQRTVFVYASPARCYGEHDIIDLPYPLKGPVKVDDIFAGLPERGNGLTKTSTATRKKDTP